MTGTYFHGGAAGLVVGDELTAAACRLRFGQWPPLSTLAK